MCYYLTGILWLHTESLQEKNKAFFPFDSW